MADERWSKGPWGYVQEWDVEGFGKEILDPLKQLRWKAAITFGGLPYIWRELAGPLNTIVYSLLEVAPGDRVLVIGESIGPCGWAHDLRGFVAPGGEVIEHELLERARAAYRSGTRGPHGRLATWTWTTPATSPTSTLMRSWCGRPCSIATTGRRRAQSSCGS